MFERWRKGIREGEREGQGRLLITAHKIWGGLEELLYRMFPGIVNGPDRSDCQTLVTRGRYKITAIILSTLPVEPPADYIH